LSSIDDDNDDDEEEEVDQYDWLDSMAKEGELPRESSLSIEGRLSWAEPPRRESEDLDLRGATMMSGGEEPLRPQELAHPERAEDPRSQQMVGLPQPLP
jgi:hypothetical protein